MCDANDIFRSSGALKVLCYRRSINIGSLRDRDAKTSYLTSESAQASVAIKECPVGDSGNKPNRNDFFKLALRFNQPPLASALAAFGSTGKLAACHESQPPVSALAFDQPPLRSSCATRALVASFGQAQ